MVIKRVHNKILINGRACAGKDEIANYLVDKYGFIKISFATEIYNIAHNLFKMQRKDRGLLQNIGQKVREIDPDIFVKWAVEEAKKYERVVIADCRQKNEYDICVDGGFFPVRVTAPFDQRVDRAIKRDGFMPDTCLWERETETGADNGIYYEIVNDDTFEKLYEQIDKLMRE